MGESFRLEGQVDQADQEKSGSLLLLSLLSMSSSFSSEVVVAGSAVGSLVILRWRTSAIVAVDCDEGCGEKVPYSIQEKNIALPHLARRFELRCLAWCDIYEERMEQARC